MVNHPSLNIGVFPLGRVCTHISISALCRTIYYCRGNLTLLLHICTVSTKFLCGKFYISSIFLGVDGVYLTLPSTMQHIRPQKSYPFKRISKYFRFRQAMTTIKVRWLSRVKSRRIVNLLEKPNLLSILCLFIYAHVTLLEFMSSVSRATPQ